MVIYHREKTEEKQLLDLCLQCMYTVLFPAADALDKAQGKLTNLFFDIQKQITEGLIFNTERQTAATLVLRIEQLKS